MLKYTGERMIPELMKPTNGMLLEHLARYHFAIHYVKGRVLDFACGSGFGSQSMAKAAKKRINEIVGIDIDGDSIKYANAHYYHPSVTFVQADAVDPSLPEKLGQFDVIVSFETLEHIENEAQYMNNIFQMLKPGGTLVISTPFGSGRGKPTLEPFHVHQLTEEEFKQLFTSYSQVDFYYQKGVLVEPGREGLHYPIGIAVCTK
ncbi:class I SAM-dependent methyltransferase [Bacillus sp. CGMCC 1.16541]|uniref:class I SAM-dependent methyltransferase n=1 Tax=Bacillus sp. CGMCC 1.16541 TaxID=2185143 RepID=UPI000D7329C2|nr:class I SAM-dependent methyltransferase [Bacillus sp. CGMCC 1.16541]